MKDRRSPPTVAGAATAWERLVRGLRTAFPFHPGSTRGTNVGTRHKGTKPMPQPPSRRLPGRACALLLGLIAGPALAGERPGRVVSLNLCADQLALALADRDQIRTLSPLARDRSISILADRAGDIPANAGRGEAILFAGADLVLVGPYDAGVRRDLLERQGARTLELDVWRSLAEGRDQIRVVAAALGQPDRGEGLIARIDAALERARGLVPPGTSILTYYRRGWVPAVDSVVGEVLRHMGFTLHQDRLGVRRGGVVRLERIVAEPPDYVLIDEVAGRDLDHGSALLVHPALAAVLPPARRLSILGALAICGGPGTPAMIDALAAEVRAKVR